MEQRQAKCWNGTQSAMRRMSLKTLIFYTVVHGAMLGFILREINRSYLTRTTNRTFIDYLNQKSAFEILIHQDLALYPPNGVDRTQWMTCVDQLADEPIVHPLRGMHRNYDNPNGVSNADAEELAARRDSYRKLHDHLRQQMRSAPVSLELLSAIRGRILEDYDVGVLLPRRVTKTEHSANCEAEFCESLKNMGDSSMKRQSIGK